MDLSHIVTDSMKADPEDSRVVTSALKALETLVKADALKTTAEYAEQLALIKTECDKGLQYKMLAGQ